MKRKLKVYVGCALTHASPEFIEAVKNLKQRLEDICEVLHFKGLADANQPHDVYVHDIIDCVYQSDLVVSICDLPSIGLGYEMASQAEARRKPLLAVAHESAKVTKLIIDPRLPDYEFRRYRDMDDLYGIIAEKIEQLSDKMSA